MKNIHRDHIVYVPSQWDTTYNATFIIGWAHTQNDPCIHILEQLREMNSSKMLHFDDFTKTKTISNVWTKCLCCVKFRQ